MAAGSHDLVPIQDCAIAEHAINQRLAEVRSKGTEKPYKVEIAVQPSGEVREAWNAPHSSTGFRQVHEEQNKALRQWITNEFSNLNDAEVLFDLYGGSGNLSEQLVDQFKTIHVVDSTIPKHSMNDTSRTWEAISVKKWCNQNKKPIRQNKTPRNAVAILDPPRSGLGDDVDSVDRTLKSLSVRKLILVGCDADAWIRDISQLQKRSWKIVKFAAFDFFPQTHHIESVALLELCLKADQFTF